MFDSSGTASDCLGIEWTVWRLTLGLSSSFSSLSMFSNGGESVSLLTLLSSDKGGPTFIIWRGEIERALSPGSRIGESSFTHSVAISRLISGGVGMRSWSSLIAYWRGR